MASRVEPMRIDDIDVLVQVAPVAGTEPTSAIDKATDRMAGAFERAKDTIVAVSRSTVEVVGRLAESKAAHPERIEVEFGLGFTAKGNVIVAETSAEVTLKVKLTYEVNQQG